MIQTSGKVPTPGAAVVTQKAVPLNNQTTRTHSIKRSVRMVGAGLISAALVGVFALPAYASTGGSIGTAAEAETAFAQALTTSSLPEIAVPAQLPTAEEQPLPVVVEVEAEAAGPNYSSLPAGAGAPGIVNGALAQLGWGQDCTDLVQNSLAAIGLVESNNHGNGPDLGVGSFASFGAVYSFDAGALAPGDLLIWPGAPHAAVYVGGGQAVHGGWNGGSTVLTGIQNHGAYPDYVVRVG